MGKQPKQGQSNIGKRMRKLAFVLLVISIGGLNTHAQGTIQFQNSSAFPVTIGHGGSSQTPVGTNAQSESLGAGPGQVTIDLYVALASAPNMFFLAGTTTNSGSTSPLFQGTFHGGSPYSIPSNVDGSAFLQGTTVDYYFTAETASGIWGQSATGTGYMLGGGSGTPPATFGTGPGQISSGIPIIILSPEPSTVTIGFLGAAALFFYRRNK
jgi:hypothetical protein